MPFDDLKTLPKPEDWPPHIRPREAAAETTPTPVAWAVTGSPHGLVHLCDSYELADRVARAEQSATGKDHRVRPLVYGDRPSGVTAAVATAADVARSVAETPDERHDATTCRGERQELAKPVEIHGDKPDVGEGWVGLGPDELLQADDECDVGGNCRQWVPTLRAGQRVGIEDTYRRRVTPETPEAPVTPAPHPDADGAWGELRRKAYGVAAQANAMLVEALKNAASENAALRSEVERLRLTLPAVVCEATKRAIDEIIQQGGEK
jgi:hypothetical protein